MRKLGRETLGQIQANSAPVIVRAMRMAWTELSDMKLLGEPLGQTELINAWIWGVARMPPDYRRALTDLFVRELERWQLEQPQVSDGELFAAVRAVLCGETSEQEIVPEHLPGYTLESRGQHHSNIKPPRGPRLPRGKK
jgi:hypothetical protein